MELEELIEPDWTDRESDSPDEAFVGPEGGPVWVDAYEL